MGFTFVHAFGASTFNAGIGPGSTLVATMDPGDNAPGNLVVVAVLNGQNEFLDPGSAPAYTMPAHFENVQGVGYAPAGSYEWTLWAYVLRPGDSNGVVELTAVDAGNFAMFVDIFSYTGALVSYGTDRWAGEVAVGSGVMFADAIPGYTRAVMFDPSDTDAQGREGLIVGAIIAAGDYPNGPTISWPAVPTPDGSIGWDNGDAATELHTFALHFEAGIGHVVVPNVAGPYDSTWLVTDKGDGSPPNLVDLVRHLAIWATFTLAHKGYSQALVF